MAQTKPNCNKTYTMYHGTTKKIAKAIECKGFRQSADGMLGRGVYLSRDLNKARWYPRQTPARERVVLMVKVNVGNVIAINYQGHPRQKNWHDRRFKMHYDTAWCPPDCGMTDSGMEENCIRDPDRITVVKCITSIPRGKKPSRSFYE